MIDLSQIVPDYLTKLVERVVVPLSLLLNIAGWSGLPERERDRSGAPGLSEDNRRALGNAVWSAWKAGVLAALVVLWIWFNLSGEKIWAPDKFGTVAVAVGAGMLGLAAGFVRGSGTADPQSGFCTELTVVVKEAAAYVLNTHTLTLVNGDAQAADVTFPVDPMVVSPVSVAHGTTLQRVEVTGDRFAAADFGRTFARWKNAAGTETDIPSGTGTPTAPAVVFNNPKSLSVWLVPGLDQGNSSARRSQNDRDVCAICASFPRAKCGRI